MSNHMIKNLWLIGAGVMAQDYVKVLKSLVTPFTIIGKGKETAKKCEDSTGYNVIVGGNNKYNYR